MAGVSFYISGHGFGHASRQIEIINALGAASPSTSILIRTSAPRWLFDRTLRVPAQLLPGECDTGVVQLDSLHLDATETIRRAAGFHRTLPERAAGEAALLRDARRAAGRRRCAAAGVCRGGRGGHSRRRDLELHVGLDLSRLRPGAGRGARPRSQRWATPTRWRRAAGACRCTADSRPSHRCVDLPFVARHARRGRAEVRALLRAASRPAGRPAVVRRLRRAGHRSGSARLPRSLDRAGHPRRHA